MWSILLGENRWRLPRREREGRSYGLYDLIKPGQFDGILLAADIGHGPIGRRYKKFLP